MISVPKTDRVNSNKWKGSWGGGKGSDPRPINKSTYDKNHDAIDWSAHRAKTVPDTGRGKTGKRSPKARSSR